MVVWQLGSDQSDQLLFLADARYLEKGGLKMRQKLFFALMVIVPLSTTQVLAAGADNSLGQSEYDSNCAVCHGKDGAGGGPYVELLTPVVPDLRTLQKANNGVFPFERVYEVIDGRAEVKAHGPREMPIWGNRYNTDATEMETMGEYAGNREAYVRARILALISYLSTLQQK